MRRSTLSILCAVAMSVATVSPVAAAQSRDGTTNGSKAYRTKTGKTIIVSETHPDGRSLSTIEVRTEGFEHDFGEVFQDRDPVTDVFVADLVEQLKRLLAVETHLNAFKVVHGKFALDANEIAVISRSMLQIMTAFASGIETPPDDMAGIHMNEAWQRKGLNKSHSRLWIHVKNGASKPESAFVAVHYRDRWFWIDDRDVDSKSMFNFLMVLFSFTERGKQEPEAPVITVPIN